MSLVLTTETPDPSTSTHSMSPRPYSVPGYDTNQVSTASPGSDRTARQAIGHDSTPWTGGLIGPSRVWAVPLRGHGGRSGALRRGRCYLLELQAVASQEGLKGRGPATQLRWQAPGQQGGEQDRDNEGNSHRLARTLPLIEAEHNDQPRDRVGRRAPRDAAVGWRCTAPTYDPGRGRWEAVAIRPKLGGRHGAPPATVIGEGPTTSARCGTWRSGSRAPEIPSVLDKR